MFKWSRNAQENVQVKYQRNKMKTNMRYYYMSTRRLKTKKIDNTNY